MVNGAIHAQTLGSDLSVIKGRHRKKHSNASCQIHITLLGRAKAAFEAARTAAKATVPAKPVKPVKPAILVKATPAPTPAS